jgi:RES domain-containing protein
MGDDWLKEQQSLLLKVPSVIIPSEYNILINPLHPLIKQTKIKTVQPLLLENRLQQNLS